MLFRIRSKYFALCLVLSSPLLQSSPTAALENQDLACAWPVETTPSKANVAYPDANATYWTMPFFAEPGLEISVSGTFPDARYFGLDVYGSDTLSFTRAGLESTLPDYMIEPDIGTENPWQTAGSGRGSFTVLLTNTPRIEDVENALPLSPLIQPPSLIPLLPDNTGYLMMRVYLPKGGDPNSTEAVTLPNVTFTLAGASVTLSPCDTAQGEGGSFAESGPLGSLIHRVLNKRDEGPCQKDSSCPPLLTFIRAGGATTPFPNGISGYAAALYQPAPGFVSVVQAVMPTSSKAAEDGPAEWPEDGVDLRYWSFCNYLYLAPFPVIEDSGFAGCQADYQVPLIAGTATVVLSSIADRPALTLDPDEKLSWLPTSSEYPNALEVIAVRNMLPAGNFAESVTNISNYGDPDLAVSTMGTYYPKMTQCTLETFNAGGVPACFADPRSPPERGSIQTVPITLWSTSIASIGLLALAFRRLRTGPSTAL